MRRPGSANGAGQPDALSEALSSFGFQYLSETYLPLKLQEGGVRNGVD